MWLIARPIGEPGSGTIRYAAAMSLFKEGKISTDLLEVYRQCSKFDGDDPIAVAKYLCVSVDLGLARPDAGDGL